MMQQEEAEGHPCIRTRTSTEVLGSGLGWLVVAAARAATWCVMRVSVCLLDFDLCRLFVCMLRVCLFFVHLQQQQVGVWGQPELPGMRWVHLLPAARLLVASRRCMCVSSAGNPVLGCVQIYVVHAL